MSKALVLLSGGLDSTVVATMATKLYGNENVGALNVFYGQKHKRELVAFDLVCDRLGISDRFKLDLSEVFRGADCALMASSKEQVPDASYEELHEGGRIVSPTYVPVRNLVFITSAASFAMSLGYKEVWLGVHAEDAANDAYPDCRADVIGAIAAAVHIGSYYDMKVVAPLLNFTKADVVRKGTAYHAPLQVTWSCYKDGKIPCGICPTCRSRAQAHFITGAIDLAPGFWRNYTELEVLQ